jgi:CubicO group peptidase (beta-lactamase class C family)
MRKSFILLFILAVVTFLPLLATQDKSIKINNLMTGYHDNGLFDGVVLVSEKGQIIYHKAFGIADREWNVPMTLDTKFKIGSISKVFTAFLILQLVQDGTISLDGTIADYLPDYTGKQKDRITIRQLLTHTSGVLNSLKPEEEAVKERLHHDLRDLIRYAEATELYCEPGKEFHYSNFGYTILACIAEKVTGRSFGDLLKEEIFTPVGMNDTRQYSDVQIEEHLARGYEYKLLKGYENATYFDNSYATGCGGLISTAGDLFKWHQASLECRLLSKELMGMMVEPPKPFHYGYGWEIRHQARGDSGDSLTIAEHAGSVNGFGGYMARILQESSLVVVLKNSRSDTYISPAYAPAIGREILSILSGEEVHPPRKSIARHIALILGTEGIEPATVEYFRIKKTDPEEFSLDESELNTLGIELMFRFKLIDEASRILKINVAEFPRSYNAYDSYAYALMQKKDYRNSIKVYQKGLEILEKFPDENRGESIGRDAEKAVELIRKMQEKPESDH